MILALAAMGAFQSAAAAYTLTPIFTYDTQAGECVTINDSSAVLCYTEDNGVSLDNPNRTFVWQDGKISYLPNPYPDATPVNGLKVAGMNNEGVVTGTMWEGAPPFQKRLGTFVWDSLKGMKMINVDGQIFTPYCLNDDGKIVGTLEPDLPAIQWYQVSTAVYDIKRDTFTPVTDMISRGRVEQPSAVNIKGEIVGNTTTFTSTSYAGFRMKAGQQPLELSTPAYPHDTWAGSKMFADSWVMSINANGWMAGAVFEKPQDKSHAEKIAAIWSPENSFYTSGDSLLSSINDNGVAVGTIYSPRGGALTATVWDREHGLRALQTLVPLDSPILNSATSINNKGEITAWCCDRKTWYLLKPVS